MKILMAVDGSPSTAAATSEIARIKWDMGTEIRIISVVETPVIYSAELEGMAAPSCEEMEKNERARAHEAIERAVATLCASRERTAGSTSPLISRAVRENNVTLGKRNALALTSSSSARTANAAGNGCSSAASRRRSRSTPIARC